MERRSKQREGQLRRKYSAVHGKIFDFTTHTIDDGTLYFTVRFTDQTSSCVPYAFDIFAVGAELSDWPSGDFRIIYREYMRPIPRQANYPTSSRGRRRSQIGLGGSL